MACNADQSELPYNVDLSLYSDATFIKKFRYSTKSGGITTPVDLTNGWSAKLQIKQTYDNMAVVTVDSFGSGTQGAIELSANGLITITINSDTTNSLTIKNGLYDLRLTSPDATSFYLIKGMASISPTVTK